MNYETQLSLVKQYVNYVDKLDQQYDLNAKSKLIKTHYSKTSCLKEALGYEVFNRFTDFKIDYVFSDQTLILEKISGRPLKKFDLFFKKYNFDFVYSLNKAIGFAKIFELKDRKLDNLLLTADNQIVNVDLESVFCGFELLFNFSNNLTNVDAYKNAFEIVKKNLTEENLNFLKVLDQFHGIKGGMFWNYPSDALKKLEHC